MRCMSSILIMQFRFNFLNLKHMYLENYILKMIKTSNRKLIYKHIF